MERIRTRVGRSTVRIMITVLILLLTTPYASALVSGQQIWATAYNSGVRGQDEARALAVGPSGHLYVVGSAHADIALIKYARSGARKWVRKFDGPGSNLFFDDVPAGIAVDGDENIYVAGRSRNRSNNDDFVLIKYDKSGSRKWVRRYDGPNRKADRPDALALDQAGNVYVTGASEAGNVDFLTLKYSPAGDKLWEARYNGPGNGWDWARAVAVDGSGNVYVAGESYGGASRYDYALIKYSSSGAQTWIRRYNGPANGHDEAKGLAVSAAGDAVVTGRSMGDAVTGFQAATVRYDTNGNLRWARRNLYGHGIKAAFDSRGHVIVGGSYALYTPTNIAVIKYRANGSVVWIRQYNSRFNGFDDLHAMVLDRADNIYIAGRSQRARIGFDFLTIRFNPAGKKQWIRLYNGRAGDYDSAADLALDGRGYLYVTGVATRGSDSLTDFQTVRYLK